MLLCIARDGDSRTRDIAEQVGITERAAQRIVADLIAEGYLTRTKIGRRNRYEINRRGHLRSGAFRDLEIGPLLDLLDTNHARNNSSHGCRRGVAAPKHVKRIAGGVICPYALGARALAPLEMRICGWFSDVDRRPGAMHRRDACAE